MEGWIKRDLAHNWHPYTQMKDCLKDPPIFIERARGLKLYDSKGNWYYDTISSWWCNVHGHNHPLVMEAIKKQLGMLDHVLFAGFTHKNAVVLAEKLVSAMPKGLTRVFFSDNGSTAVECALKMSFQYWRNTGHAQKKRFVSLDRGYHGDTIGAMSVSGMSLFNEAFRDLLFESYKVPSPYCYRCPMKKERGSCSVDCIEPLERLLKKSAHAIAGIILEPMVMAAGGMIVYPAEYLKKAGALAKRYGVHLILDEVATGFGRTGKMFACEHAGIKADLMCLSKGITSGSLPLGVTVTSGDVYAAFNSEDRRKTFYHGHTYTANPITCAAALASLDIFQKEGTLEKVGDKSRRLRDGMERLRTLRSVGDVRCIGMIGAAELVSDKKTKRPFPRGKKMGPKIYKKGLERSLILRPLGDILYLFLPLCVSDSDLERILDGTYDVLRSVEAG